MARGTSGGYDFTGGSGSGIITGDRTEYTGNFDFGTTVGPTSGQKIDLLKKEKSSPQKTEIPDYDAYIAEGRQKVIAELVTTAEKGKYAPNGREVEIIGIHSTAEGVATTVRSKFVTDTGTDNGLTLQSLDATSWSEGIEFLYRNNSGATRKVYSHTLRGKLVTRHSGSEGYLNDDALDFEDIAINGEQTLEIGNNFIFNPIQVDELSEYHARSNFDANHVYSCAFVGTHDWLEPGVWFTLNIGDGTEEDINSVVEVLSVTIERGTQGIGNTVVLFKEVLEGWKPEWPANTKFFSSGPAQRNFSRGGYVRVSSADDNETADYYCDGTADDVQIQAAIDRLSAAGGGQVILSAGTFYTTSTIVLTSNITVMGSNEGQTTIEKNVNGEAFEAIGTSGNELRNVFILQMSITKNSSDSNLQPFVRFDYTDNSRLRYIDISSSVEEGFVANYCDGLTVENCSANGCGSAGFAFLDSTSIKVSGCRTSATGNAGIFAESCSDLSIENCTVSDSTGDGINITFSPATSVTGCRVLDVSDTTSSLFKGIYVAGLGCTISACTVSNVTVSGGCDGIILSSGGGSITGCTVENVQASGDDIQGIFIFGGRTSISGCTVQNITQTGSERCYGIYADETTITGCVIDTVENTNISSTKIVRGAYLRNRSTISNSTVRSVTTSGSGTAVGIDLDTGVYAARAANGCTVESCDDYGIYVQCDDSVVSANYATSNNYGVYTETTADKTVITGNRLTSNTTANLSDNGTNTTTTGNDVT